MSIFEFIFYTVGEAIVDNMLQTLIAEQNSSLPAMIEKIQESLHSFHINVDLFLYIFLKLIINMIYSYFGSDLQGSHLMTAGITFFIYKAVMNFKPKLQRGKENQRKDQENHKNKRDDRNGNNNKFKKSQRLHNKNITSDVTAMKNLQEQGSK